MTTTCEICKRRYPPHLLHPLETGTLTPAGETRGTDIVQQICPLCALIAMRLLHEDDNYMFTGPAALAAYHEALNYLRESGQ